MKEYLALHHVQDPAGARYTPGEIFEAEYSDAAEERLIRLGAICVNGANAQDDIVFEDQPMETDEIEEEIEPEEVMTEAPMIDVMEGVTVKKKRGRKA